MSLKIISFYKTDELSAAIKRHESFFVSDTEGRQSVAVRWLEKEIKSNKMRCRIYSGYRKSVLAGALIPTGITQLAAVVGGIAMVVHNVVTWDPDYEICKEVVGHGLEVTYRNA